MMRYTAEELRGFAARITEKAGLSPAARDIFSDSLVQADLRGISSHGVTRLAAYAKRVELGLVDGFAVPELLADGGSLLSVDGKNGMGAYVGAWTMDLCIQRARERGSCFAAVSHCNHFGYAAYFTERAAEAGMLGLAIANGPKALPPTGGSAPLLGTNPLAVSLPTGVAGRPLTLDMATSAVARGKVTLARKTGQDIPLGWGGGQGRQSHHRSQCGALGRSHAPGWRTEGLCHRPDHRVPVQLPDRLGQRADHGELL